MNWFDIDKKGLAKLLERNGGKQFAVFELIQNAWDEQTSRVDVSLSIVEGRRMCQLKVADDNPNGFSNLSHAFTLFAESNKKSNPEKRGRFNLGEKLVLALCDEAEISTTTGTVIFDEDGRHVARRRTDKGSVFNGRIKATLSEYEGICRTITSLIPPKNIQTFFNGKLIPTRPPIAETKIALMTEIAGEDGILRRVSRPTIIRIYQPLPNEQASIYELGIPVVETEDKYHVDIQQKVPLNFNRDNVPNSFLKAVRSAVLNATYQYLSPDESTTTWVRDASTNENVSKEAITKVVSLRFGDKVVSYDPSDAEGSKLAVAAGYTVVAGGSMSAGEWANVRKSGIILPAGQVTPSPKPFDKDGEKLVFLNEEYWTHEMRTVAKVAKALAPHLIKKQISVKITNEEQWHFEGCYGGNTLIINLAVVGHGFFNNFDNGNKNVVLDFLLHELAHEFEQDHLSDKYHAATTKLGAIMTCLALAHPRLFV
jgi:hypothetical protein